MSSSTISLQVLLIALDDAIDNMLTMYDNHDAIKAARVSTYNTAVGGSVPMEFYLSQGKLLLDYGILVIKVWKSLKIFILEVYGLRRSS